MNQPATIEQNKDDLSTKEIILYTAGGIALAGGSIWLISHFIKKANENREQNKSFDEGSPSTSAKGIKMAFDNDGWWGTNTPELRRILQSISSKDELKKVSDSYRKLYNSNMYKDMEDELQSTEYNEMLSIIASKPDKYVPGSQPVYNYQSWAKRLKAAFDKSYGFFPGTDEDAITAVFNEIPTQSAFIQVAKVYQSQYGTNIIDDLKGELEFWEYPSYMAIITRKPK